MLLVQRMLTITALITKLIAAGVVRKKDGDVAFTVKFGTYLYRYPSASPAKIGTLSGWREMLTGYNQSFRDL